MKTIILFDGLCNLCDQSVQFIIKHDKKEVFLFASNQGTAGAEIKSRYHLYEMKSIVCVENETVYTESDAVLRIAKHLGGIFLLAYPLRFIPKALRNKLYRYVAKNRYKWFGKKESCLIPTEALKRRFLP